MLVISRMPGERVLIDGGIEIEVIDFDRFRVRLGIKAPQSTMIFREEIAPNDFLDRFDRIVRASLAERRH